MLLPNADSAIVEPRKLTEYLLNLDHPVGGTKAAFLFRFGFDPLDPAVLALALLDHVRVNHMITTEATAYGDQYLVEGPLRSPDGRNPVIRSVWLVDRGATQPRFITILPRRRSA